MSNLKEIKVWAFSFVRRSGEYKWTHKVDNYDGNSKVSVAEGKDMRLVVAK